MGAPRPAPKTRGGFIRWGETMAEMCHATEPQMRALEVLMRDRESTTTGEAFPSHGTRIADHAVYLDARAVNGLKRNGLVDVVSRWAGEYAYDIVIPTDKAYVAWTLRKARAEAGRG